MRQKKDKIEKGLSLLELMVVVIIIGVLAGLALPRYQKVVFKSKVTAQAFPKLKRIVDAERVYYLKNNNYLQISCGNTSSALWDALGLDAPHDTKFNYGYQTTVCCIGIIIGLNSPGAYALPAPFTTGAWGDPAYYEVGVTLDGKRGVIYTNGTVETW